MFCLCHSNGVVIQLYGLFGVVKCSDIPTFAEISLPWETPVCSSAALTASVSTPMVGTGHIFIFNVLPQMLGWYKSAMECLP